MANSNMIFNNFFNFVLNTITNLINNTVLNKALISFILGNFLLYRVPSTFDIFFFCLTLIILLLPYFICLVSSRLVNDWEEFFASFTPVGAPLGIAPFVSIAEGISYIVRPFVLILRPFLNLTIGAFGALSIGGFISTSFSPLLFVLFMFIFFYEIFVSLVHWFIVTNILIFSIDH